MQDYEEKQLDRHKLIWWEKKNKWVRASDIISLILSRLRVKIATSSDPLTKLNLDWKITIKVKKAIKYLKCNKHWNRRSTDNRKNSTYLSFRESKFR